MSEYIKILQEFTKEDKKIPQLKLDEYDIQLSYEKMAEALKLQFNVEMVKRIIVYAHDKKSLSFEC